MNILECILLIECHTNSSINLQVYKALTVLYRTVTGNCSSLIFYVRNLFVASVLVAGSSSQDGNDHVPTRPDVGLSVQLRQVMQYYDSVLDDMRREHKSELSTIRREHKSELSAVRREHKSEISTIRREHKKSETRLSNRISQLEAKLSKVSYY